MVGRVEAAKRGALTTVSLKLSQSSSISKQSDALESDEGIRLGGGAKNAKSRTTI